MSLGLNQQHKTGQGPRLYHTKSRSGCSRCRARRVKCNESRPVCNNCHRHNVSCQYDRELPPPHSHHTSQPPVIRSSSSPMSDGSSHALDLPSIAPASGLQHAYWELRALHHFTVVTSRTLPGSHLPSIQECWSVHVPKLALEYEPLLNALLALSALHLISVGCRDAELLRCRTRYLGAALSAHRHALGSLNKATAEAACFTSIILMVDTFATLQERPVSPYQPPMQWLRIVRGVRAVFEASWNIIKSKPTSSIMMLVQSSAAFPDPEALSSNEADAQRLSYILLSQSPGGTTCVDDGDELESLHVYRQAAGYIGSMHTAVESHEHPLALCRRLLFFACVVPERFLDLVEGQKPRALISLAYLFSLSAHAKDVWWIGRRPSREVYAIRDHISMPLLHLLDSPLQILAES